MRAPEAAREARGSPARFRTSGEWDADLLAARLGVDRATARRAKRRLDKEVDR